ncbi:unnamed protein product [Prunus armeniaca]|uniref:Uncharacterized protein n=1 Tax=Prunus armeniaca TaxID=36596 RepID=A0A6J5WJ34_PRUAR|nr:unnamed protein product [Prunus armeniaca]
MVEVDDDQLGKLKTPNPSDDQSLIRRLRNEDGDRKVSKGSKKKRQLIRIEILPLVLSNDSEVSGDDFEGGVHGGRVGQWGCGKRQSVWVRWGLGFPIVCPKYFSPALAPSPAPKPQSTISMSRSPVLAPISRSQATT